MGECFMYASLDREEYFFIDAVGGAAKRAGLGRNLGARALGLLILNQGDRAIGSLAGAWADTRIVALGDQGPPLSEWSRRYEHAREKWTDIGSSVVLMMLHHDGTEEILREAETHSRLFLTLADLAMVHRVEGLERTLTKHFGKAWRPRYASLGAETRRSVTPPPDAGSK